MPSPTHLSITEAAQRLGVATSTVREAVRRGELPAVKLGDRILIPDYALDATPDSSARAAARLQLRLDEAALEARRRVLDEMDNVITIPTKRRKQAI